MPEQRGDHDDPDDMRPLVRKAPFAELLVPDRADDSHASHEKTHELPSHHHPLRRSEKEATRARTLDACLWVHRR